MVASIVLYTCVATMISQAAVIGYFWSSGALTPHKARQIADVLAGVDMIPADSVPTSHSSPGASQQVSYEEVLEQRVAKSLNLDLREQAVAKGIADLQSLAAQLQEDTRRFDMRKQAFNDNLDVLAQTAKGTAITDVRLTLEAMRPRQAKDQMMRMLKDDQMEAVVTIIKGMTLDKRKKLLAEFKAGDEPDRLADILKQILQGIPETAAIEQAQNEMAAPPN
jgi:hypothetical protein